MEIDIAGLRHDLIEYFGSASDVIPYAESELVYVSYCSDDELLSIAIDNNFNLDNYKIEKRSLWIKRVLH